MSTGGEVQSKDNVLSTTTTWNPFGGCVAFKVKCKVQYTSMEFHVFKLNIYDKFK